MHRLMAVPASVVLFLSLITTTAAQDSSQDANQDVNVEGSSAPNAAATAADAGGGGSVDASTRTTLGFGAQAGASGEVDASVDASGEAGASTTTSAADEGAADEGAPLVTTSGLASNAAEAQEAGSYTVRLRDLEQRINSLKEQIFRSKARLSLLAETVLQGVVAGAQARIVHKDKMGSSYKLVRVVYALDGAPIFNSADESGALSERGEFDIYNGSIVPGEHTLTVTLQYRGHGYGIFSYLKGYRFNVSSSYTFTAAEGKMTELQVVGYEQGGPTTPLEERPQVRFMQHMEDGAADKAAAAKQGEEEEEGGE